MRAVEITEAGPYGSLKYRDNYPTPSPARGEVLVKVAYAALNRADLFQKQGKYPPPDGASPLPGLEVSGAIEALGEDVEGWEIGTEVCTIVEGGGYAEYVTVPVGQLLPVPDGWNLGEAAALPEALFTNWLALCEIARLQPGESVLIHGGASGIGHIAIQLANALHAKPYVTAGTADKCHFCIETGAITAVNYREETIAEAFRDIKFDVILDIVGGDYMQMNLKLLKPYGRIVNIAFLRGSKAELNMAHLLFKQASWHGMTLRNRTTEQKAALARQIMQNATPWLLNRQVIPRIDSEFPLKDAEKAHAVMEENLNLGKILLKVSNL